MPHSLKRAFLLLSGLLLTLASVPGFAQRGALTVPRNLSQLTDRAAVIVRGNVVSARIEKHPEFTNLHTVVVTLRVKETLKGEVGDTYTFRQYIWDIRDRYDVAGYRRGLEVILLMNAPNQHGLTSPAGMEQGRFRVFRDRSGNEVAVNGLGNHGLFHDMETQLAKKGARLSPRLADLVRQQRGGPLAVRDLHDLIHELRGSQTP